MNSIQLLTYIYILIFFLLSLKSYKLSISLIWGTLIFIPTVIIVGYIRYFVLISLVSCFLERKKWIELYKFVLQYKIALLFYIGVSLFIVVISDIVPIKKQLGYVTTNIGWIILICETFLLCKNNHTYSKSLLKIICFGITANIVYCLIFEIILRTNPAGLPLYMLMGIDNNEYLADMVNRARGQFEFRLQSIFGHPLSLGQYFMVLTAACFMINNKFVKILLVIGICIIVYLTGTRGAFVPLFCIVGFKYIEKVFNDRRKIMLVVSLFILFLGILLYINTLDTFNWGQFAFWDDQKQYNNNIKGSDMALRISQLEATIDEIENNPLCGKGFGYREFFQEKYGGLHPKLLGYESVLILHLVERGWLGLLFFFITIGYIYYFFKYNTSTKFTIMLVFFAYCTSIIITGVRPLTFGFVGLICSIICGMKNIKEAYIDK